MIHSCLVDFLYVEPGYRVMIVKLSAVIVKLCADFQHIPLNPMLFKGLLYSRFLVLNICGIDFFYIKWTEIFQIHFYSKNL